MPFCAPFSIECYFLRKTEQYACELILDLVYLMLPLYQLFFALLQDAVQFIVLSANIFHSFLNQIYKKRFMCSLNCFLLCMRRLLCYELRYFGFTMIAIRHDFFHLIKGIALIQIFFLICFVLVIFDKISFDRPTLTVISAFKFRDYYLFLFSLLICF